MFRSPPPHRRSSGHSGGKAQFEREQRGLQKLVRQVGYDNLPINDESLRPFLKLLWDFARSHDEVIWTIDTAQHPERLYQALVGSAAPLSKLATELQAELLSKYTLQEIARTVPVFVPGKVSVAYFEGIWTPKAALESRRH